MRCFYSKAAYLIVFWNALLASTVWSLFRLYAPLFRGIEDLRPYYHLALVPVLPFFICVPLAGWFADVHYGNFKVFRVGSHLVFLSAVLVCACVLVLSNIDEHSTISQVLSGGVSVMVCALGSVGEVSCAVTALQLGLDQMPDASSDNISSFVNWFIFAMFAGFWTCDMVYIALCSCTSVGWSIQLFSLFPVVCSSILCASLFLIASKWLIIEPKCSQSLKTVYQVLKFAAKHKAPLYRSALTYWEEDIPSRLDLGKSRYGGPFTTEQVEDVKTFFKVLLTLLPMCLSFLTNSPMKNLDVISVFYFNKCTSGILYAFTYSPWLWLILMTATTEFIVYPLFKHRLPAMLKCIGIMSFLVFLTNFFFTVISVLHLFYSIPYMSDWQYIVHCILLGSISQVIYTKVIEFVCAQSPYNMRGMLAGYMGFIYLVALGIGIFLFKLLSEKGVCHELYCLVIQTSLATVLSLIGFILHCVLARWYKRRVRDEEYDAHRVVEEVYDRYLSDKYSVQ